MVRITDRRIDVTIGTMQVKFFLSMVISPGKFPMGRFNRLITKISSPNITIEIPITIKYLATCSIIEIQTPIKVEVVCPRADQF